MKIVASLLAAGAIALTASFAVAQQKTETIRLTIGSSHPPVIPWVAAMKNTVVANTNKELEEKGSKYRVEWNEAYGGVLFNFENTIEAVEQGITDFGWVGTLWEPAKMPLHNIGFALPFVTDNPDTIYQGDGRGQRQEPRVRARVVEPTRRCSSPPRRRTATSSSPSSR